MNAPGTAADAGPPGVIVLLPGGVGPAPVLPGVPVWPDLPWLRRYGNWRPGHLRTAAHAGRRLLVLGHCLESPERISRDFRTAVDRAAEREARYPWAGTYATVLVGSGSGSGTGAGMGTPVVRGDMAGQFAFHISVADGHTLIGTHAGLLARLQGRLPDPVALAASLVCPQLLPVRGTRSAYRDVRPLAGIGDGLPLSPPDSAGSAGFADFASGAAELREALDTAVAARCGIGTETGTDLSGGLDSTSLAFLAARQPGGRPVRAIAYHHPHAPAGDLADAERLAALDGRLALTVVAGAAGSLPYAGLSPVTAPRETADPSGTATGRAAAGLGDHGPDAGRLAAHRSLLRLRATVRDGVHLTGEGGDAVAGVSPAYLADLSRSGPPRTFARHCLAQARRHDTSALTLAGRARRTARTDARTALAELAHELRHTTPGGAAATGRAGTWADGIAWWPWSREAAGWLTPPLRAELADVIGDPRTAAAVPEGWGPADAATAAELRQSAETQRHLRELGGAAGVDVHAPYLDDTVLRAALRVRPAHRADPHAAKPLLAAALRGMVPDEVFAPRAKGDYTREEYLGVRLAAPALRRLFEDSRLADLGVVEPCAVLRGIERMAAGLAAPLGAVRQVVAAEVWLRDIERDTPGQDIEEAQCGFPAMCTTKRVPTADW